MAALKKHKKIERILITGAEGFLASRIREYYGNNYEVIGVAHRELDITDKEQVRDCMGTYRPDAVVHCAAISDTAACEKNPALSYEVNVKGAEYMAMACAEHLSRLIFCSSDQVYFGSSERLPHREEEVLCPPHSYGQHKLEAEKLCRKANQDTVILRLSWMYDWKGMSEKEHGNLVTNVAEALAAGKPVSYPIYDYRSITYVWEVVEQLEKTFLLPPGVYNFGSANEVSTYEVVRQVVRCLGHEAGLVQKNETAFVENPRNLRMNQEKLNMAGIFFADTREGMIKEAPSHHS